MFQSKKLWLIPLLCLAACSGGEYKNAESYSAGAPAAASAGRSDTLPEAKSLPLNSSSRKVIHTVDFNCKVENVFVAVNKLENLVKSTGGIVQESHIGNRENDSRVIYYKPDSLRKMVVYTTTATLTLRIPAAVLDSVINVIPSLSCFIDSRTIKQSDVTWKYLANELKNNTGNTNTTTKKALALARKSKEPIEVQKFEDEKEEQKTDRKIENLNLLDDVNYPTLTVVFTQPEQVFVQTIVNASVLTSEPFSSRFKVALSNGWDGIGVCLVGLVNIWPLWLLIIPIIFIIRRFKHRKQALK